MWVGKQADKETNKETKRQRYRDRAENKNPQQNQVAQQVVFISTSKPFGSCIPTNQNWTPLHIPKSNFNEKTDQRDNILHWYNILCTPLQTTAELSYWNQQNVCVITMVHFNQEIYSLK